MRGERPFLMVFDPHKPLIAQSDRTVLLEVDNPSFEECRDRLALFAELVKSPEHIHTFRITPLSIWNAAAAGVTLEEISETLHVYSKFEIPSNLLIEIKDSIERYGRIWIEQGDGELILVCRDPFVLEEIRYHKKAMQLLSDRGDSDRFYFDKKHRGDYSRMWAK